MNNRPHTQRNPATAAHTETVTLQTAEPDTELLFDYTRIPDPAQRESARYAARQIKIRGRRALIDIWEAGRLALETQNALGHGLFIAWAKAEFGESVRTVQRWRDFAARVSHAELEDTHASLAALLEATTRQTPDEVLERVLEKAATEPITVAQVRALREEHATDKQGASAPSAPLAQPPADADLDSAAIPPHEIEIDTEGMWRVEHLSACNRALGSLRRLLADANSHGIAAFPLRDAIRSAEEYILRL